LEGEFAETGALGAIGMGKKIVQLVNEIFGIFEIAVIRIIH